jgi:hypothetical protein
MLLSRFRREPDHVSRYRSAVVGYPNLMDHNAMLKLLVLTMLCAIEGKGI